MIDVIDSGIGMKPETLGRLFNAFVQADSSTTRKFGGTGLGLAISRKFAQALEGDITVSSELGKGTTFTVMVPLLAAHDARWIDAEAAGQEFRKNRASRGTDPSQLRLKAARVLVVDDGEPNRELIQLVLRRAGLTVDEAENGLEALTAIQKARYDVVLMDMQMPVKDGYTATAELRQLGHTMPVIALTGHAMKGDEDKCRAAGCTGYLTKPVNIDELLQTITEIVGRDASRPLPVPASVSLQATKPSGPIDRIVDAVRVAPVTPVQAVPSGVHWRMPRRLDAGSDPSDSARNASGGLASAKCRRRRPGKAVLLLRTFQQEPHQIASIRFIEQLTKVGGHQRHRRYRLRLDLALGE